MNKTELIERIIDRISDPYSEYPEDYADLQPITLEEAEEYIKEYRKEDKGMEEDECLPAETTPELFMEAENCYIESMKFEFRSRKLADWLTENEPIAFYDSYVDEYKEQSDTVVRRVLPVDFLKDTLTLAEFPFDLGEDVGHEPTAADLIVIGQNSKNFKVTETYCYYEEENDAFVSTDSPFGDGVIDAKDFAEFVLLNAEALGELIDGNLTDDEVKELFGCTKEELIHE